LDPARTGATTCQAATFPGLPGTTAREPHGPNGPGVPPSFARRRTPMTGPTLTAGTVPVGPTLSMFDPIYVGINEFGHPVYIRVIYKNLLAAGQPGGGNSGLMRTLTPNSDPSPWSRVVLFAGTQV